VERRRETEASDGCLREQRERVERTFAHGWVTEAREPVAFSEDELGRIEQVRDHGGFLNAYEHEYLQWVKAGGRWGDPLPAAPARRDPFISGIADDFEVRITDAGDQKNVAILFSHQDWPGVRFGHRFPTPEESDGHDEIWLMEEVETGALSRLMARNIKPDGDGVVWTDW
jgi:hypothetical protein